LVFGFTVTEESSSEVPGCVGKWRTEGECRVEWIFVFLLLDLLLLKEMEPKSTIEEER
jgi:hypothetical protein